MAYEKRWAAIAPRLLIADGTSDGLVTVADAIDLHVKQIVLLKGTALSNKRVQINEIASQTEIYVGPVCGKISDREDVSAYTTAAASTIESDIQKRPDIPDKEYRRAMFEEEPVVAQRVINVDPYGEKYTFDNPAPTRRISPNKEGRITKITINDTTWTALERSPTTNPIGSGPLNERRVISIQNLSGKDVFLQFDGTVLDNTITLILSDGFEKQYEIGPNITVYAKSDKPTADIVIEELA